MSHLIYILPICGYLLGSIPFGLIISRCKGIDIRAHGSGNIGATNCWRVLGRPYGIAVFLLDFAKGLLPVLLAEQLSPDSGSQIISIITGIAAILGHNFPIWLRFRGGKGVATSAGVLLALAPLVTLAALVVWLIITKTTRYISLASIAAGISLPIFVVLRSLIFCKNIPLPLLILSIIIAALAIIRHRGNLSRLRAGKEDSIDQK